MATFSLSVVIACGVLGVPDPAGPAEAIWRARVTILIQQLGDPSFTKREAATKALLAEGDKIVPLLDHARKTADLELSRRIDRIRYQLVGFMEDLTDFLRGPAFNEDRLAKRTALELLLEPDADPLPEIVAFVAAHQPNSGDFLLKIIANPNHPLHRPATQLFCESWSSGSVRQLQTYLEMTFQLQAVYRTRYPEGIEAFIETRFWHPYGSTGWPKNLNWQIRMSQTLNGKQHVKPMVYKYPGAEAATGWINAGKLEQGDHQVRCTVDCTFDHPRGNGSCKVRSAEFAFAVGPAILVNELIAPSDAALIQHVRTALRMLDYEGQDGGSKVASPWRPQVIWQAPPGMPHGLHVPVWSVKEPLPVDLCFDVTIRDVATGARYPAEPLVLHKGRSGRGAFKPRDAITFCGDRDGFTHVQMELRPSPSQALNDPAITGYFNWPITSPTLRAKIIGEPRRIEIK